MSQQPLFAKILRWCVYALALVPLIIFSQYVSPFHFGKVVVFRSFIEIMLALYLILAWQFPEYRPRRDKIFWALLTFTAAYSITSLTSVNFYQSFWGTLERMGGVYSFWHYFVFYVIAVAVLKTKEDWTTFLKITIFTAVLSAFYGFGQRTNISFFIGSGGRSRIFGTIGNAALFAGYELLNLFLALILALSSNKKNQQYLYVASALIMGLAIFMTAVRGSILGLGAGLLVFAWLYFDQTRSRQAKRAFLFLAILAVVFVGFTFLFKNSSFVKNSAYLRRITDFSPTSITVQTRVWAWQAGLKGWKENPKNIVFGWGPENFNIPFSKYFNPKFFDGPGSETLFDRAHNMFVEILVTTGLLGFLAYVGLFAMVFKSLWQLKKKPEFRLPALGLIGMTVAYIIHNSFIFDTSANFIVFFSILAFISHLVTIDNKPSEKVVPLRTLAKFVAFVLVILAIFLVYQTNIKTTKANHATTRGIVAGWNNDFNGAVQSYEKAASYNVSGRYEYRNRYAQFLLDYSNDQDVSVPNVQAAFKEAIALEEKNAAENPQDYLPELYLSRLNIILGKSDQKSPYNDIALAHSLKALSYSPTFVRTYYEIGQAYLNKGDYKNAIAQFQKALDLSPTVGISYWYLGAVEMQAGQADKGLAHMEEAIQKGYLMTESDYLNLANVYIKKNDFPHLVSVYEGLMRLQPRNAQYAASLAVTYARVGRLDDAVTMAKYAAQLDPSFEPEAKKFVQQLGKTW